VDWARYLSTVYHTRCNDCCLQDPSFAFTVSLFPTQAMLWCFAQSLPRTWPKFIFSLQARLVRGTVHFMAPHLLPRSPMCDRLVPSFHRRLPHLARSIWCAIMRKASRSVCLLAYPHQVFYGSDGLTMNKETTKTMER